MGRLARAFWQLNPSNPRVRTLQSGSISIWPTGEIPIHLPRGEAPLGERVMIKALVAAAAVLLASTPLMARGHGGGHHGGGLSYSHSYSHRSYSYRPHYRSYVYHPRYRSTYYHPHHYYTNLSGDQVHTPVFASSRAQGASAHCADGTWSFSQHARGTCSHHGGVASW
jgi:hypothetical protein